MAQFRDDCFLVDDRLLSVDEAVALIAERVATVAGPETVPLREADGRVAASDVLSRIDVPPFANSAVDGYALRAADLATEGPTILPVVGRVAAGQSAQSALGRGAVRIFTGAPLPEGFDTIVMQEDVETHGDRVTVPAGVVEGVNRRPAGEDVARGAPLIRSGRRLRPPDLALAAAAGESHLAVRRRLRVAMFSTGDELVEPGGALGPGLIHDSNRTLASALLHRMGAAVSDLGILPDRSASLADRLAEAAEAHDLVLTSGGVSTGDEDHVRRAVEAVGRLVFWRLAVKPGRPVALGSIRGTPFVGLPGNPVAVYVNLLILVRPLLARLSGETYVRTAAVPIPSGFAWRRKPGRREFLRVSLREDGAGLRAFKFARDGSGLLTPVAESDGLVDVPDHAAEIREGDILAYLPHALLW